MIHFIYSSRKTNGYISYLHDTWFDSYIFAIRDNVWCVREQVDCTRHPIGMTVFFRPYHACSSNQAILLCVSRSYFRNFCSAFNEWAVSRIDKVDARVSLIKLMIYRVLARSQFSFYFYFTIKGNRVECKFIKHYAVTKSPYWLHIEKKICRQIFSLTSLQNTWNSCHCMNDI